MKLTLATAAVAALALALASPAGAVTIQESATGIAASTDPAAITLGPDGSEWFGAAGAAKVGRVAPPLGTIPTYVSLPVAAARARAIAAGPDGNVWYLDWARAKVGRVTPAGVVTEFDDGQATGKETTAASAGGIVAGPDGNVWYVVNSAAAVFHITPDGGNTRIPLPGAPESWSPTAIAAGPDGNLWFVDRAKNAIVRITPAGVVTQFTAGLTAAAGLTSITAGGDGNLWFTEAGAGKIGRITTSGSITEYPVSAGADPESIAAGPDGFVWFTDTFGGAIGRVTTAGIVNEYTAGLSSNADPTGIAPGADGGLWFSEKTGNRIGHINTDAPSATTVSPTEVGADSAQLNGQVDPRGLQTSAYFEYGATQSYGQSTPEQDLGSVAGAQPISAALSALTPDTTYHFRVVATSAGGTIYGTDQTFTTSAAASIPPDAVTDPASNVTGTGATLNGRVNPNGAATTYRFDWGTTASYGNTAPATPANVGSDTTQRAESQALTGLTAGSTYHYRIEATNAGGTSYGRDQTLQTLEQRAFPGAVGHVILGSIQFDITSYAYNSRDPAHPRAAGQNLSLVKLTDATTPALLHADAVAARFPLATVEVFRPGTRTVEVTLTLNEVLVTQVSSALGQDDVGLNFETVSEQVSGDQQASDSSTCKKLMPKPGVRPRNTADGCSATLKPSGSSTKGINRALKHGGLRASFYARVPGTVEVTLTAATRKPATTKRTVVARLTKTFTRVGSYTILVRLTKRGRATLRQLLAEIKADKPLKGFLVLTLTFAAH